MGFSSTLLITFHSVYLELCTSLNRVGMDGSNNRSNSGNTNTIWVVREGGNVKRNFRSPPILSPSLSPSLFLSLSRSHSFRPSLNLGLGLPLWSRTSWKTTWFFSTEETERNIIISSHKEAKPAEERKKASYLCDVLLLPIHSFLFPFLFLTLNHYSQFTHWWTLWSIRGSGMRYRYAIILT